MNIDEAKQAFRAQILDVLGRLDKADPPMAADPQMIFASGMLCVLSSIERKDGRSIPLQIAIMHAVVREIGEERGWKIARNVREK